MREATVRSTIWRSIPKLLFFEVAGALICASPLSSQVPTLHLDSAVRVTATAPPLRNKVGRVLALSADSLWIVSIDSFDQFTIPLSALSLVEVQVPSGSTLKHFVAGTWIGTFSGIVVLQTLGTRLDRSNCPSYCSAAHAMMGAVLGGTVGAFVGLVWPTQRWVAVPEIRLGQQSLGTSRRTLAIGVELRGLGH